MKNNGYSIIVTAYNSYNYIEECLDSIDNQTYFQSNTHYEIIVGVDGCEKTLQKLKEIKNKYSNIRILYMPENKGTYITTNTLILESKFDKILRFDSDDVMDNDMISKIDSVMDRFDICRFGYTNFRVVNGVQKLFGIDYMGHGVSCFKWSVYEKVGGYKPWKCASDTDMMFRTNGSFKVGNIKHSLFKRRLHTESLTARKDTGYTSQYRREIAKKIKPKFEYVDFTTNKFEEVKK